MVETCEQVVWSLPIHKKNKNWKQILKIENKQTKAPIM